MLKKTLTVGVVLIFVGMIFVTNVNAYNKEISDNLIEPCDLIGRQIIRCFGFFPNHHGDNITFFVIRLKYSVLTDNGTEWKIIRFRWITLSINNALFTKEYTYRFNFVIYFVGVIQGEIQIKPTL